MRLPFVSTMTALLIGIAVIALLSAITGPASVSLLSLVENAFSHFSISDSSLNSAAITDSLEWVVFLELRLPRVVFALCIGCILAQSGATMQGLFRNPLADPGIIGVSSGAALGAIAAIVLLPAEWKVWSVPLMAFVCGLATTLFVYTLAHNARGTSVLILLLAGVAISAFSGAAIGLMSYFADNANLRELSVWQMGTLANASTQHLLPITLFTIGLAYACQRNAASLNALLLGEPEARHLGIDVEKLKRHSMLLVALGVGVCVSYSGILGFIGLVVPHLVRMLIEPDHRFLLPLSALMGGLLLLTSDLIARILISPAELPIGLITALMGAPFFVALLIQERKRVS